MGTAEGYALSPAIAATSTALIVSHMALALAPSTHVFSTVSNLCYLSAGFYREAMSLSPTPTASHVWRT